MKNVFHYYFIFFKYECVLKCISLMLWNWCVSFDFKRWRSLTALYGFYELAFALFTIYQLLLCLQRWNFVICSVFPNELILLSEVCIFWSGYWFNQFYCWNRWNSPHLHLFHFCVGKQYAQLLIIFFNEKCNCVYHLYIISFFNTNAPFTKSQFLFD